jgi:RHS repeat-associated protein
MTATLDPKSGTTPAMENGHFTVAAPVISLPKGGGAIRGVGEKFAANPVTGTGSLTVPIATSPGRSGFGPQLSLSYDSGAGNGLFGFGWNLSLPAITRKTDKGLPQYQDVEESDVFVLSGAEDLVPAFKKDADGNWEVDADGSHKIDEVTRDGYRIRGYHPRIEGLFARIERWTNTADGDVHWQSISKDNILTLYGKDSNSRVFDSADPAHIFTWLICETRDDKGNAVLYEYKAEDGTGVDLAQAHERNRGDRNDARRGTNRYLKHIRYGNRVTLLDGTGKRPRFLPVPPIPHSLWMFEVVFDYGEHDLEAPMPDDADPWPYRSDPFSSYRAGFEVRTGRLCQRVLMFHHFPGVAGVETDCLVRSTDFTYAHDDRASTTRPVYTFLREVTHSGYKRDSGGYLKSSFPPIKYEYTQPTVDDTVHEVDAESLENLPIGVDGASYQWTDLHGEGIPGILTEQASAWYYKRNISPMNKGAVEFAPAELVATKPNLANAGGQVQFMDLAGDGQPDLVVLDGAMPGLYEHDEEESWQPFRPFTSRLTRDMRDPNVKFIDLDGDGHADVLISEDEAFVWHASLAELGFGPARSIHQPLDEDKGPRLVFADGSQSIYLADLSGDGLTDLARIRNGEICYWPNLGYGRFGAKVMMDDSPCFDNPDQFDQKRIRLADIDGSGTTDIIYLHRDGARLYFNQSGNSWSLPHVLKVFPSINEVVSIVPTDLLGTGTACLVWSSPLPGDGRRPMRYVNLMGSSKPHLLVKMMNNLGAETRIHYAASTKFYLQDKRDGRRWITRLPFPVHVVERVETYDYVSRNRFVTRYAYHHGHFDGEEREFRGFGMVEQWDVEQISALTADGAFPQGDNITDASHVPPIHTKTWFHTGVYLGRDHVSDYFAGLLDATGQGEYFREPGLTDEEARALLLPDTVLPDGLTLEEDREACRALKGAMLRQEVYADDARPGAATDRIERARTPYTVTEQNFSIHALQPKGTNRHGVFFSHKREALSFHYERNPADPRIQHALTLQVDAYGNVLKQAAIGYGRRTTIRVFNAQGQVQQVPNPGLAELHLADQGKQTTPLLTYTENRLTNAIESADTHRNPLPCEALTFELTGYRPTGPASRYQASDFVGADPAAPGRLRHKFTAPEVAYEATAARNERRRPIEWLRTLYRRDDMGSLLPLGELHPLALPGESYKLAFTPGVLTQVFRRPHAGRPSEALIPDPAAVLGGQAADRGGYLQSQTLKADARFPATDADDHWWVPSGQSFFTNNPDDPAATELAQATQHFFVSRRYRNPFGQDSSVDFDATDLLIVETRDALGNRLSVDVNDYRVLQPQLVTDPNGNQTAVAFDALGMVVGTAVMGKQLPAPTEGDSLTGFVADLTQSQLDSFHDAADPHTVAPALLQDATTRIIYDLDRFRRTQMATPADNTKWLPSYAATLARESHANAPLPPQGLKLQISFSYSDGFGREVQKKIQAEPEKVNGVVGPPRWVGSGWTITNNKGKPVRQYEPFFSALPPAKRHHFEFGVIVGVSPVLFYDPAGRVIATLHPNHTFEKVVFDPWRQTSYDVNDTCAPRNAQTGDPRTDPNISGYVAEYFANLPASPPAPAWETWRQQRIAGALGPHEQAAAARTEAHADTPTTAHFDALGRPFVTVARNRVVCAGHGLDGTEANFMTRVELDIEGNQRAVRDAIQQAGDPLGRIVMRYAYDMLGNRIHQLSMEAGARWILNDVAGKPIRAWDGRGHNFITAYDALRRPIEQYVRGTTPESDPRTLNGDIILVDKIEYGESVANAKVLNLRTRIYRHFDSAGVAANTRLDANGNPIEAYDFKGNLLCSTRRLVSDYTAIPDWLLNPQLDKETFAGSTRYDALNRPIQSIAPHSSLGRAQRNVIQPVFNDANLLERIDVWLARDAEPAALLDPKTEAPSPVGVANINYDAKGQRLRIAYKNGAGTLYSYDPLTFRLTQLLTQRNAAAFPGDDLQPPIAGWPGRQVQNLSYTYDPAGNITHLQDDAQQTIYFSNKRVEPSNDYLYDALYRLLQVSGREHLGQAGAAPIAHSHNDSGRVSLLSADAAGRFAPNDGNAMGTYIERYVYDAVGNFLQMQHRGGDPAHAGWTRAYDYFEPSLIEDGSGGTLLKTSNRLSRTMLNSNAVNPAQIEPYLHDAHGNIVRMPHLGGGLPGPNMHWDYKDQLRQTDIGGRGTAFYVYDASGQRVRKVWEKSPRRIEERIYLGGFEIFRKHDGAIGANTATLERETLVIRNDNHRIVSGEVRTISLAADQLRPPRYLSPSNDDGPVASSSESSAANNQFIALVETRTVDTAGNDPAPLQLIRYQFSNHLGSSSLELNNQAQIISYEEYSPYGSTSYQAVRSRTETPKRYRYTSKERDEETGLCYHGARYYSPWLGTWTSCDPGGLIDGVCLYLFAKNNPANLVDPTGHQSGPWGPLIQVRRLQEAVNKVFDSTEKAVRNVSEQAAKGDLHEGESTWGGVLANVVIGLIPYVGQAADARDTVAAAKHVSEKPSLKTLGMLGIAGIAWIPLFGDIAKGLTKTGKRLVAEAAHHGADVEHLVAATRKIEGGKEILTITKSGLRVDAFKVAENIVGDLGDDAVNKIGKFGTQEARIVGRQSADASRGWRIDFDPQKGAHYNWWNGKEKGAVPFSGNQADVDRIVDLLNKTY